MVRSQLFLRFPQVFFGMSTRLGGVSPEPYRLNLSFHTGDLEENVRRNRELFFERFNGMARERAIPGQVHGDTIRRVQVGGSYERCDGLLTNVPGCALTVTVADCLPVMLYEPAAGCVGAIHAGWRGCRLEIVKKGVRMMKAEFGATAENILAFVGPGAGACCYEVGEEIARVFNGKYIRYGPCPVARPRLDLKLHTLDLLLGEDLQRGNIELADDCTICSASVFHSYRRQGQRSGRMMAVIGLV